jgi:hypothetical protein
VDSIREVFVKEKKMNTKSIYKTIVSGEKGPRIVGRTILGVILVDIIAHSSDIYSGQPPAGYEYFFSDSMASNLK